MTVQDLERQVEEAATALARRQGQHDRVASDYAAVSQDLLHTSSELAIETLVLEIFNKASVLSWVKTKTQIEDLVNRALRAVFTDRTYKFSIEQETKRGVSSVNFNLVEGDIVTDVWDDGGLGVADVVGFSLRIAYLALHRPKLAPVLFVDEPFRFLSEAYRPNAARFVKSVATDLGIQIICVTHDRVFSDQADQVVCLEKNDNVCYAVGQTVRSS